MAIQNFIREIWESRLESFRRKATVFGGIVNRDYEGMITGINQVVKVRMPGFITINNYTRDIDLTLQEPTGTETEVTVDTEKYWGVKINDVDAVQMAVSLMDSYLSDAGYRIALLQDDYVLNMYDSVGMTYGSTDDPIDVTKNNIIDTLSEINLKMSENDLPDEGRWLVCPPWFIQKIIKAKIEILTNNIDVTSNGTVGRLLGFTLRQSNRVKTVDTTKYKLLAGYGNSGISFVNAFTKTKAVEPDLQFYEGVVGLHVYGGKMTRPDTVLCATCTKGTD